MKSPADVMSGREIRMTRPSAEGYCRHGSARHIRAYLPYAEANTIRLRVAKALGGPDAHVSWLYEIKGGWGWTICSECRSRDLKSA